MKKLIAIFLLITSPVLAQQSQPPLQPQYTPQELAREQRHHDITKMAIEYQKQRDAEFEKHRLEVKKQDKAYIEQQKNNAK